MNLKNSLLLLSALLFLTHRIHAQNYGDFPTIRKDSLLLDFELLKQGLEKIHTGLYWYTPKDSFDLAFADTKNKINKDMNVMDFYKTIAPLISLTKEDHTNISLPDGTNLLIREKATFLPILIKFLGTKMYCNQNRSGLNEPIQYKEIETINGETPKEIVSKLSTLYANDGNIIPAKYTDLDHFIFSMYYYLYYGNVNIFEVKFKGIPVPLKIEPLPLKTINANHSGKYSLKNYETERKEIPLAFRIISDSIAYIGAHTFSNSAIKRDSKFKTLNSFLKESFKTISEKEIKTLIIDVSQNGGGSEGNEGILYSYLGENYQKYLSVKAKKNQTILNNGIDTPVKLRTYGFLERLFTTQKLPDGGLVRRNGPFGFGLMAYKKEPKYKFKGDKIFVIISPITYSGGSEFANMVYTQDLATFVGQETGGGYYGNTSGYTQDLILPHSEIAVEIPALQFKMNVKDKIPLGRGVLPDFEILPTIEQYEKDENVPLNFILNILLTE